MRDDDISSMRKLITPILASLALAFPSVAGAQTIVPLWAPMQVNPSQTPTQAEALQFKALSGWAKQGKTIPKTVRFWQYVKGTRSYDKNFPESWYIHQDGVRVRDKVWHSYVMDPSNPGWQSYVAAHCAKYCYLDGVGSSAISRTVPRLQWSKTQWVDAITNELQAIVASGKHVMPNSTSADTLKYFTVTPIASTEAWKGLAPDGWKLMAAGRVWVVAKGSDCGWKLAEFLVEKSKGDLFSCHAENTPAWTIPNALTGDRIGRALGPAVPITNGWMRNFTYAKVKVYTDGTYSIVRI